MNELTAPPSATGRKPLTRTLAEALESSSRHGTTTAWPWVAMFGTNQIRVHTLLDFRNGAEESFSGPLGSERRGRPTE